MTFGGYDRKLDHGVAIIYLLQPEWWDYIYHKDLVRHGKAQPLNTEWRSQDHIKREIDEAIAALYNREKFTTVRDIAHYVEVSDKRVSKWIRDHRPIKRKQIKRKKEDVCQLKKVELLKKNKCLKRNAQQVPAVKEIDSDNTDSD